MGPRSFLTAFAASAVIGCSTLDDLPPIPEYHPANASASEGVMEPSFKVLAVVPELPPDLPVPQGEHKPPMNMPQGGMHGMPSGPSIEPGSPEATAGEWGEELAKPLHGEIQRPGMREGMPEHQDSSSQEHSQPQVNDEVKRGEAQMPPVVIPSEQRGMKTDATLYHEHEGEYSTRIVHPARRRHDEPVTGPQVWACPRHADVAVYTPGGRCPKCDTILVPVKAPAQPQGISNDE